ncbi:MAG: thermonuclease family protein [Rhodospirillaceae bacterium]
MLKHRHRGYRLLLSVFVAVVTAALALPGASLGRALEGVVVGVTDGDTLTVLVDRHRIRVRLSGIDAPERGQPYGARARQSLADLCYDRIATVATAGTDRYGRTLGVVSCEGIVANREQVRRGLAWVYTRYTRRDSPLHAVQLEARTRRRALWQLPEPQPPWEWRSRHRAAHARSGA